MTSDGALVVLIVGLLLGYLIALTLSPALRRAQPRRRRSRVRNRVCRLAASGFATEVARVDIPGAAAHCKVSGQVEMTVASGGPVQSSLDLDHAPAGAGLDKE